MFENVNPHLTDTFAMRLEGQSLLHIQKLGKGNKELHSNDGKGRSS